MADSAEPRAPRPRRCPLCGRPVQARYRPFCSTGCRDRDLLAWLEGRHAVPAVEIEADAEPVAPPPVDR